MNIRKIYHLIILLSIFSFLMIGCKKDKVAPQIENKTKVEATEDKKEETNQEESQGESNEDGDEEVGEITLYNILGNNIEKIKDYKVSGNDSILQKDVAKHQEIWGLFKKIIPLNYRDYLKELLLFSGEQSGVSGYVSPITLELSKWQMGLAIDFAYDGGFNADGEFAYTIIHEFGHVLTLNNNQINSNIDSAACQNYFPGEGCAQSNAYINKLFADYWTDIWDEFEKIGEDMTAHEKFYEKYKDRFVTSYAATNPAEDIAEVFSFFVTQKEKPTGKTIAEKKILMFYEYPEFIELRDQIRKNTQSSTKASQGILPAPGSWKQANRIGDSKKSHGPTKY